LDGTPLESAAAEKAFARMFSAAGIASIHFSPKVTQASLARFVRGFPTGTGAKPAQLVEQLKAALQGDPSIHVNEVCFVPADSAVAKSTLARQLATRSLGMNLEQTDDIFNDPEKLLQLIMAAEGNKGGPASRSGIRGTGDGFGNGSGGGTGNGTGGAATNSAHGDDAGASGRGPYPGGSGGGSFEDMDGATAAAHSAALDKVGPTSGPTGGWNIVNGTGGGGTPLDPNVGGFWLKGSGPNGATPARPQGNVAGSPGVPGQYSGGGSGEMGGGGAPVDPNAGGARRRGDGGSGSGSAHPYGTFTNNASVPGQRYGGGSGESAGDIITAGGSSMPGGESEGGVGVGAGPGSSLLTTDPSNAILPGRWSNASSGIRTSRIARGSADSMPVETGLMTMHEEELQGILKVLAQIGRTGDSTKLDPTAFQSRLSTLPRRARFTVSQALSALAAQAPAETTNKATIMKLAEHIAVRFALESYERGDVKVNNVRDLLSEMNQELDGLRKILGVYEETMVRHGIEVEVPTEVLAQEFWANVPEEKRISVLESADAWCVPAQKIREYVEELRTGEEPDATVAVEKILKNYASCITNEDPEQRRQVAMGIAELAPLYASCDEQFFIETIRTVGVQLGEEKFSELQSAVGAAFVRLSQEASRLRSYPAIQRSVELVDYVEGEQPGIGSSLRPRIGVEDHLAEFIDEALRTGSLPAGLRDLLRRMPQPAADQIAARFTRAGFREDCDLLVSMIEVLGPEARDHLRRQLREGNSTEAVNTIGILARIDLSTLEKELPAKMGEWRRTIHDRVVRQIASSGAPERGRLLLELFDTLDPLIRPFAVDEIGMSGENMADLTLLRIADGDLPEGATEYLRLKAIEALGRLRTAGSEHVLRNIAESKKTWRWANPYELRLVAAQAMDKIDPEWVRSFMPLSGLSAGDFSINTLDADPNSSAIRQRRYPRLRLEHPVNATTMNLKENYRLQIPEMALGGGIAICQQNLHPGSIVDLRLNTGQRPIRAQAIVRDANTQARVFEVVDMDLEERAKLRKLLVQLGNALKKSSSQERSRRGFRTIKPNIT
jgi:hypothetical protein